MALPRLDPLESNKENKKRIKNSKSKLTNVDWGRPLSTENHIINEFKDTGWVGNIHLDKILSEALEAGASDIHITTDEYIYFSILGDTILQKDHEIPNLIVMEELGKALLTNVQGSVYAKDLDYQFSYTIYFGPYRDTRFRVSIGYSLQGNFLVFRHISNSIPTVKAIGLENEILDWLDTSSGLVLICGATGSGKSTTLASIIDKVRQEKNLKITTIEKPIEYIYPRSGKSLVIQREVDLDVLSFSSGLSSAMRQDPDLILIGEVRDNTEVSELIRAAETGHLSFSTMHTNSVSTTINRIQNLFIGADRSRILNTLGDTLQGICNQTLVKAKDGKSRFAVREVLTNNNEVRELIMAGDVQGIRAYQRERKITMEYNLARAFLRGKCTKKEARLHAPYPHEFDEALIDLMEN